MRITRKFSLDRIGLKYESLTIEVEGDGCTAWTLVKQIDDIYKEYIDKIQKKEIT